MYNFDRKFENFTDITLSQAAQRRDEILSKCGEKKKRELARYETVCANQMKQYVEETVAKLQQSSNQAISQKITEGKKAVFSYRETLIGNLFTELDQKVDAFVKSDAYPDYVKNVIQCGENQLGGKDLLVTLDKADQTRLADLIKLLPYPVAFEDGLRGGAIVLDTKNHKVYNGSIQAVLAQLKENFLEKSGFAIY